MQSLRLCFHFDPAVLARLVEGDWHAMPQNDSVSDLEGVALGRGVLPPGPQVVEQPLHFSFDKVLRQLHLYSSTFG